MGKERTGRSGADLTIELPVGTLVTDRDTGILLIDLDHVGASACVARGGRGGRGNRRFATPTHRTPTEFEPGEPRQERRLRLELKLIADVGIIGLPNAGKSTFLSRVSRATPRIAAYPFTTLEPNLGIVELTEHRRMVLADIPGLIEGAHRGAGLGDGFLRHIERTRVLLHLVEIGVERGPSHAERDYHTIRHELEAYGPELARKTEIVVLSKIDLADGPTRVEVDRLARKLGKAVFPLSSVTGVGLRDILEHLWRACDPSRTARSTPSPAPELEPGRSPGVPPHRSP